MFLEAVHCIFERVELDVGMHGRFYVNLDGRRDIHNPHRDNALCRVGLRTARFSFQTRVLQKAPSWFFEKSFYPWVRPAALAAPSTRDAASTLE